MASKTCVFLESGTNAQFDFVLTKYQEALNAKAYAKSSKPETLLKLDKWYQTELPKKIKSRGTDAFLTHDEIVQTIKWKLARGQFRPRLKDLVQMNTPRVVMQETKKAFRAIYKKKDLEAAVLALSNLKGVGPAMASAVLAAGAPEVAPFMADECLLSMPDIEGIDYTTKEYLKLVEKTNECVQRLNSQGGQWTPHKVELALWTHYVARDIKPEILADMPGSGNKPASASSAVVAPPISSPCTGTSSTESPHKKAVNEVNGDAAPAAPVVNGTAATTATDAANTDDHVNGVADKETDTNGVSEQTSAPAAAAAAATDATANVDSSPPAKEAEIKQSDKTEKVDSNEDRTKTADEAAADKTHSEPAVNGSAAVASAADATEKPAVDAATDDNATAAASGQTEEKLTEEKPTEEKNAKQVEARNGGGDDGHKADHGHAAANGVKQNGDTSVANNGTADNDKTDEEKSVESTKEESGVNGGEPGVKRSLESDEPADNQEHKRLKEDNTNNTVLPAVPATGDV